MITQTLKLNLIPGQVLPRVNVSQYDAGTRTLQMLLYNGDQAFNISAGLGGFVQGTKPDRTGFQYAATVTEGSNVVTLVITQQMTAVSGEVTCELVIANGNDRIATVNFILYVEPAALADDTVISDTELPLIEEAAELAQRIDGIVADVEADADRAEAAVEHYPYIGANGNWYVFDLQTEQFVDTTIAATGPQGPTGPTGPQGPTGPTGPTGNGIQSITKTGTSGLVDTYTILFTNGTTTTFTVTNGQDGQGSGDMTKAVYDSTNAVADAGGIVAYVAAHSGAGTLAGLDDVTLSSLAAGDTLVYNATTQKWENSTVIQTLTNQVKDMNNVYGSKNLLPKITSVKTKTSGGITYTFNEDGTIFVPSGSVSTGNSRIDYFSDNLGGIMFPKDNIKRIMSIGKTSDFPNTKNIFFYVMGSNDGSTWSIIASKTVKNAYDDGDEYVEAEFTPDTYDYWSIRIQMSAMTYSQDITFKPMIRLASIVDGTYEPYAKTNQQLTEDTTALLDNTEVNGAVNMLPNTATTQTVNGITFTVNDDGTITCNGTATGESSISYSTKLKKGTYRFSGVPKTGSYSTYWSYYQKDGVTQANDFGDGLVFYLDSEATITCVFRIKSGYTANSLTFKPMITVPSYNGDYVPYAMTNRELTEKKLSLSVLKSVVADSSDFADFKTKIAAL